MSISPEGCREVHSVRAGEDCLLLLQLSHLDARCRRALGASVLVLPSTKAEGHQPTVTAVTAEAQLWDLPLLWFRVRKEIHSHKISVS